MDPTHLAPGLPSTRARSASPRPAVAPMDSSNPTNEQTRRQQNQAEFDNSIPLTFSTSHLPLYNRSVYTTTSAMPETSRPGGSAKHKPSKLVLCFDGTGNKFHGDDSDSNILKLYRMLDRNASNQFHYYQPGIGTYVISSSLSHTSLWARFKAGCAKAKDSAIGSSFDQHVVGGYKFLMRHYQQGDEIYIFGFSRGAYVGRFLAEMLDYVGLLSHGNEEMVVFAWKAFAKWQARQTVGDDKKDAKIKQDLYEFMQAFRETFSRPVRRIRFLGLFDTVNSVPQFEAAWMSRSKMPYTAYSSARVIRHAVSIDERRAKFRQDLIYQSVPHQKHHALQKLHEAKQKRKEKTKSGFNLMQTLQKPFQSKPSKPKPPRCHQGMPGGIQAFEKYRGQPLTPYTMLGGTLPAPTNGLSPNGIEEKEESVHIDGDQDPPARGRVNSKATAATNLALARNESQPAPYRRTRSRSKSRGPAPSALLEIPDPNPLSKGSSDRAFPPSHQSTPPSQGTSSPAELHLDTMSQIAPSSASTSSTDSEQEAVTQDVDEVWFAGGHGDVGGGWEAHPSGRKNASHIPLAWMVREAMKAGLTFDRAKVVKLGCADALEDEEMLASLQQEEQHAPVPALRINSGSIRSLANEPQPLTPFHRLLHEAHTSQIHDSLSVKKALRGSLPLTTVLSWRLMEWLPFRRMDLQPDGRTWKPVRWPLPRGEVRDVPLGARVHGSVVARMRRDRQYRPGNLIVGGGGRGVRRAPEEAGMGDWECVQGHGDVVEEIWVRRPREGEGEC